MTSIVHVLSSFGLGGQERVALALAAGMVRRGHRVAAISLAPPPDGPLAAEFRDAGVAVHTVAKRRGIDATLTARLAWRLGRLGAEVVHTHNPLPLIYAAPAARLLGAVAIHTKHGLNPGSRGHRLVRRGAAELVDAFVAVSQATAAQALDQHDTPAARLRVIANGVPLEQFGPDATARAAIRAELRIPGDAWVVGSVGRIDEVKNHPLLVRAMAPALAAGAHLVIAGDGPARAPLDEAIAALPPAARPRVHLLGRRLDVPRVLAALDVFALPSTTEGLPLAVPEAMATALPVVATAVGGLPGVLEDGVTGLLCPVDEAALRARLDRLAADPADAARIGARARQAALARFSAARMLDDYLALYDEARARRRAADPPRR